MSISIITIENDIREILIRLPSECDTLDYKIKPYDLTNEKGKHDFAHDVVAFLNAKNCVGEDKYVIFGVANNRYPKGLQEGMLDDATFQQNARTLIRPRPCICTGTIIHDDKTFGYIYISKNNMDFPYEIAKTIHYTVQPNKVCIIAEGQALMRVGSSTEIMTVADRNNIVSPKLASNVFFPNVIQDAHTAANGLSILTTIAFIGEWDEKSKGDRDIISRFVGENYETWISKVQAELTQGDGNVVHTQSNWKLRNREATILKNAHTIFDRHLDLFNSCALIALKDHSPKYELPAHERMMASVRGKENLYSTTILKGLSEMLALLRCQQASFVNCTLGKVDTTCKLAVRGIFTNCRWETVRTIGWNLSFLAQAAPDEFLSVVGMAHAELIKLFQEGEDGITNLKYGQELLNALQIIAWDKRYTGNACLSLARIGAFDARAIDALVEILLPWHPQTTASIETRVAIVKESIKIIGECAWKLVKDLLPGNRQSSRSITKPQYMLGDIPEVKVLVSDYWDITKRHLEILLELTPRTQGQVFTIIDLYNNVPEDMREMILQALTGFAGEDISEENRYAFWDKICEYADWHDGRQEENRSLSDDDISKLRKLATSFEPQNKVKRFSRLFAQDQWKLLAIHKYDKDKAEILLKEQQCDAIKQLWEGSQLTAILSLVEASYQVDTIGYYLASVGLIIGGFDEQKIVDLFSIEQSKTSQFAVGYIRHQVILHGIEWACSHKIVMWEPLRQANLYTHFPITAVNIMWIENQLGNNALLFWQNVDLWSLFAIPADEHLLEMLIKANRIVDSLEYCHQSLQKNSSFVSTDIVLNLFETITSTAMPANHHCQYCMSELIAWLQQNNADVERLALLEWRLFNILEHGVTAKTLFYKISSSAPCYMKMVKTLYKRHDGGIDNDERPDGEMVRRDAENLAHHCFQVLHEWKTMPGTQLDGSFDSIAMETWIAEVRQLSHECSRYETAMVHLGQVAYYAPPDEDGFFINKLVAEMLNARDAEHERNGFQCQVTNARGVHTVDPTGDTEFALEKEWRSRADAANGKGLFLFGQLLEKIAESFHHEGERNIISEQKYKLIDCDE